MDETIRFWRAIKQSSYVGPGQTWIVGKKDGAGAQIRLVRAQNDRSCLCFCQVSRVGRTEKKRQLIRLRFSEIRESIDGHRPVTPQRQIELICYLRERPGHLCSVWAAGALLPIVTIQFLCHLPGNIVDIGHIDRGLSRNDNVEVIISY